MTEEENYFVNDLIRARIFDIEKTEEIDTFISEGIFDDLMDLYTVYDKDEKFIFFFAMTNVLLKY